MKLDGKTNEELIALRKTIEDNPTNRNPLGSLWMYTKAARKKFDLIDRQITHNLVEKRKAEGNPVPCDGYSGRKQNRR
jgi:hypothetical protein